MLAFTLLLSDKSADYLDLINIIVSQNNLLVVTYNNYFTLLFFKDFHCCRFPETGSILSLSVIPL